MKVSISFDFLKPHIMHDIGTMNARINLFSLIHAFLYIFFLYICESNNIVYIYLYEVIVIVHVPALHQDINPG